MNKKESRIVRIGEYDIDKYIVGSGGRGQSKPDPLDEILEERKKHLAEKARELQAKAYIRTLEKEAEEGLPNPDPAGEMIKGLMTDPTTQRQFLALTPEERSVILAGVNMLRSQGTSQQGMGLVFPLMLAQMQSKPQTSIKEMIELIQIVAKPQSQNQGGLGAKDLVAILTPLYAGLSAKDQALMNERLETLRSQIASPLDSIKMAQELATTLGAGKASDQTLIELEKLKGERLDRQMQFEADQRHSEQLLGTIGNTLQNVMSGPVGKAIQAVGEGAKSRIARNAPGTQGVPNPVTITCPSCKKNFVGSSDAAVIPCPWCGTQLTMVEEPEPSPQPGQGVETEQPEPESVGS